MKPKLNDWKRIPNLLELRVYPSPLPKDRSTPTASRPTQVDSGPAGPAVQLAWRSSASWGSSTGRRPCRSPSPAGCSVRPRADDLPVGHDHRLTSAPPHRLDGAALLRVLDASQVSEAPLGCRKATMVGEVRVTSFGPSMGLIPIPRKSRETKRNNEHSTNDDERIPAGHAAFDQVDDLLFILLTRKRCEVQILVRPPKASLSNHGPKQCRGRLSNLRP